MEGEDEDGGGGEEGEDEEAVELTDLGVRTAFPDRHQVG